MSRFSIGQLVTSVMHEGVFAVHHIVEWKSRNDRFYRYTIRRGEEFISDNPEVWLSPARVSFPHLRIVIDNKFPLALSSQTPIKAI